jgi:hypothetical protein
MTNKDDNFAKHCIIWMKKKKKKEKKETFEISPFCVKNGNTVCCKVT